MLHLKKRLKLHQQIIGMDFKIKQIIAISIGVLPVYSFNIYINLTDNLIYKIDEVLYKYLGMVLLAIILLFILNKYLLNRTIKEYNVLESSFLLDMGFGFLILIAYYFLLSLGQITYWRWIGHTIDQSQLLSMIENIFSNRLHTIILTGPFVIITQGFWLISLIFLLHNLWSLYNNKIWHWIVIIFASTLSAFTNLNNGISGAIFWFTIILTTCVFYYRYRRVIPGLLAFLLFQWFDIVSLWYYFSSK